MKRLILAFLFLLTHFSFAAKAQQPCALSVQGTVKNTSCQGGMDGAIRLQVTGGTSPYTFIWSNGEEGTSVSQLTEGTYTVNVRDRNGCVETRQFSVGTESIEPLAMEVVQLGSVGEMRSLKINFDNGNMPYAITIKNLSEGVRAPITQYNGQALRSGTYMVEAFNEAGCSTIQKVIINAQ